MPLDLAGDGVEREYVGAVVMCDAGGGIESVPGSVGRPILASKQAPRLRRPSKRGRD